MDFYVNIQKKYPKFQLNVEFHAQDGITGILGASGSGKSLTLKCIAGVETPDSGVIRLNGRTLYDSSRRINLPPQQRQVGYLFQSYALFPNMTVRQNILSGLHRFQDKKVREQKLTELITLLRLDGLQGHFPSQLSGGQAQRVALARILATQPQLLLLDEPFSAIDSYLRDQVRPQIQKLLKDLEIHTIMVTHDREEAYHLCKELRILHLGRIIRTGDTRAVFRQPETLPAARLTGCRNIIPARRFDSHQVEIPSWGVSFTTAEAVPCDLTHVGIYDQRFYLGSGPNAYPVVWQNVVDTPFDKIGGFMFAEQHTDAQAISIRFSRSCFPDNLPSQVGIMPEDILLLKEGETLC